jgi:hypothetical protein
MEFNPASSGSHGRNIHRNQISIRQENIYAIEIGPKERVYSTGSDLSDPEL